MERLGVERDAFAAAVFDNALIESRNLSVSLGSASALSFGIRAKHGQDRLFEYAVNAVDQLDFDPAEIGTLVTASSWYLGVPTLGHRLLEHYNMHPTTDTYHLVGVGCAGAVPLVRLASQTLDVAGGKKGLIVAAERASDFLTRIADSDRKVKKIGSAIFGDGFAATLVDFSPEASGPEVLASKVHRIAGTLDVVKVEFTEDDMFMNMDRQLPNIAGAHIVGVVDEFLAGENLSRGDIDHWMVHPGAPAVAEAVQAGLSLTRDDLEASWNVLAKRGNVGLASIFYVLLETLEHRHPAAGTRGLMLTIGPGVMIGLMLVVF
jgi:alkylresorcinol/alkylpyrone synthase